MPSTASGPVAGIPNSQVHFPRAVRIWTSEATPFVPCLEAACGPHLLSGRRLSASFLLSPLSPRSPSEPSPGVETTGAAASGSAPSLQPKSRRGAGPETGLFSVGGENRGLPGARVSEPPAGSGLPGRRPGGGGRPDWPPGLRPWPARRWGRGGDRRGAGLGRGAQAAGTRRGVPGSRGCLASPPGAGARRARAGPGPLCFPAPRPPPRPPPSPGSGAREAAAVQDPRGVERTRARSGRPSRPRRRRAGTRADEVGRPGRSRAAPLSPAAPAGSSAIRSGSQTFAAGGLSLSLSLFHSLARSLGRGGRGGQEAQRGWDFGSGRSPAPPAGDRAEPRLEPRAPSGRAGGREAGRAARGSRRAGRRRPDCRSSAPPGRSRSPARPPASPPDGTGPGPAAAMKLSRQLTVFGSAIFCVVVFSLYLMLDRGHLDRPESPRREGAFPQVSTPTPAPRTPDPVPAPLPARGLPARRDRGFRAFASRGVRGGCTPNSRTRPARVCACRESGQSGSGAAGFGRGSAAAPPRGVPGAPFLRLSLRRGAPTQGGSGAGSPWAVPPEAASRAGMLGRVGDVPPPPPRLLSKVVKISAGCCGAPGPRGGV